jgi:hypothetical protein
MGWALRASIEYTDRMVVFMGPAILVASYRQMFGFLHYFIGWLRRQTGYGPADRSVGVLWIVLRALFLWSNDSVQRYR